MIGSNGDNKSKVDDEKRLLRHVDSVIETIMDETRLSEGEGELSKVLRGQSQPTGIWNQNVKYVGIDLIIISINVGLLILFISINV